jgi:hypothetical protein
MKKVLFINHEKRFEREIAMVEVGQELREIAFKI